MKKYVDKDKLQEFATKLHNKQKTIFATQESIAPLVGSPLVASTAAEMTDTTKIYVYVGSETGYTSGNWYYYDGSEWQSGGIYNSTAIGDGTITNEKLVQTGGVLSEVANIRTGVDGTIYDSAGDAVRGQVYDLQKTDALLNETLFGTSASDFLLEFENGTYKFTAKGSPLVKYYGGGYDKTRKVVKSTTFDAPCPVKIKANAGYSFTIFTSENGVITGSSGLITEYEMTAGLQYGMTLRTTGGTDDISALSASDIVSIEYASNTNVKLENVAEAVNFTSHKQDLLLNEYNEIIGRLIRTNNTWASDSTCSSYLLPRPKNAKTVTITANDTQVAVLCMLTDRDNTLGANAHYALGTGRTVIPVGTTQTFILPNDCKYIFVLHTANGDDYAPSSAYFMVDGVENGNTLGLTVEDWIDSTSILSMSWDAHGDFRQGKKSSASSALKASEYVPITHGKMLELPIMWSSDTTYPNYGTCLYDENGNPMYGRAISALPNRTDTYVVRVKMYLPENAKYFRTTYWSDSFREQHPNDIPEFTYNLYDEIPDEYKPITHELPIDTFMQNSIRRARQLTDIKWTPRVNIPRYSMMNGGEEHFLDWFYADHEYVGIPYSGAGNDESHWSVVQEWGYTHNWVGQHIPIESFVTAARYPNSIFSETTGRTSPSYDSSPFGIVCTALVNYVVDGPTPLRGITNFFRTSDKVFGNANPALIGAIDKNTICIGDFLYTRAHVIFISDLMRDEDGNVTHIEMSEATTVGNANNSVLGTKFGGVARRKMWEINEFKERYSAYELYRRKTFYGIPYTPSKYVDTGNEGDKETMVDFSCIPYLGEGAIYKVGYIHNSKICIGATGFTTLVVTKDGEAFGTFDVTGLTEVSVGFSEVGNYEAHLENGNKRAFSCHWSVVA